MAFLPLEKNRVYELLGLFPGGTFDIYETAGQVISLPTYSVPIYAQASFTAAQTTLEAIIVVIEAAADGREDAIREIITEYATFRLQRPWSIEGGGVEGASGLRMKNSYEHRNWLKHLLEVQLGYRVVVHPDVEWGASASRSISVGR